MTITITETPAFYVILRVYENYSKVEYLSEKCKKDGVIEKT
jgi:hypothetical protein